MCTEKELKHIAWIAWGTMLIIIGIIVGVICLIIKICHIL